MPEYKKVPPTVLVTGASGFIAGSVIKQLLVKGYKVRGTVRSIDDQSKVAHLKKEFPKLELFEADLMKDGSFTEAVAGCMYVLHTASPFQNQVDDPQRDLVDPAVNGTKNVVNACLKASTVKRVVVTSSCAAIGPPQTWMADPSIADNEKVFSEEDWNTTSNLKAGPYRYSKRLAEEAAWELVKGKDLELAVICPSFVLGPPFSARVDGESQRFIHKALSGAFAENGCTNACFGVVDVRDVAAAHVAAMEKEQAAGNRYILSSDRAYDQLELCNMLLPKFKAYPLPTKHASPVGYRCKYNNEKAKKELGIKFKPLKTSMNDMATAAVSFGMVARKFVLKKPKWSKVAQAVRPEARGLNLKVKVLSSEVISEKDQDGDIMRVAEVKVGDSSGTMTCKLRKEQIDVAKVDSSILLRNAHVRMFKGFVRVEVDKWGKIEVVDPADTENLTTDVNTDKKNDKSATEYELVG